jgi:hypothetical protein
MILTRLGAVDLERASQVEWGDRLFDRTGRGMVLSDFGRRMLADVRVALESVDHLSAVAWEAAGVPTGRRAAVARRPAAAAAAGGPARQRAGHNAPRRRKASAAASTSNWRAAAWISL